MSFAGQPNAHGQRQLGPGRPPRDEGLKGKVYQSSDFGYHGRGHLLDEPSKAKIAEAKEEILAARKRVKRNVRTSLLLGGGGVATGVGLAGLERWGLKRQNADLEDSNAHRKGTLVRKAIRVKKPGFWTEGHDHLYGPDRVSTYVADAMHGAKKSKKGVHTVHSLGATTPRDGKVGLRALSRYALAQADSPGVAAGLGLTAGASGAGLANSKLRSKNRKLEENALVLARRERDARRIQMLGQR